jgi:transcriptional regulator with XRE-family HTH domain
MDSGSNLSHLGNMRAKTISPDLDFKRHLSESIRARMDQHGLSISQLAERMGTGRAAVRRILDASNTSITFRSINRAAQAVGLKVTLIAEPMSPEELGELAHRLANSKKPGETRKLKAQILKGFYGEL